MLETFLLKELPLNLLQEGYFMQQDGASAHYAQAVKALLDENFPGWWISSEVAAVLPRLRFHAHG
jgi:hypothetical protein